MANFPMLSAHIVVLAFRIFLLFFLVVSVWSLALPQQYRDLNLKLYERHRWLASESRREKMQNATLSKLRMQSGLILIYTMIMLFVSFRFFS